jgi:DNA polymerase-3 subunit epsilon
MRFTAIDFETANADRGSVCAVGLIRVDNGDVVGRVSQLIRPEPLFFDPFNVAIHGISPADVADAPTFAEFWPSLWAGVEGPLVAHNAAFDMSVLRRSLDRAGTPYPETDYFCTRVISKLVWPQHPTHALDYVARTMGIRFRHHDALEDARACALIAVAACRQVNVVSLHDLKDTFGLRVGRLSGSGHSPCGAGRARRAASIRRR